MCKPDASFPLAATEEGERCPYNPICVWKAIRDHATDPRPTSRIVVDVAVLHDSVRRLDGLLAQLDAGTLAATVGDLGRVLRRTSSHLTDVLAALEADCAA